MGSTLMLRVHIFISFPFTCHDHSWKKKSQPRIILPILWRKKHLLAPFSTNHCSFFPSVWDITFALISSSLNPISKENTGISLHAFREVSFDVSQTEWFWKYSSDSQVLRLSKILHVPFGADYILCYFISGFILWPMWKVLRNELATTWPPQSLANDWKHHV